MIHTPFAERQADYYDRIYADGCSRRYYRPVYEAVLSHLGQMPVPSVLEVGCGTGALGLQIHRSGIPYRGFDLSPVAVARSHAAGLHPVWVGSAYDADNFAPPDYNLVLALEVFEHIDDLRVLAHLPPDVHVLFSVPDFVETSHLRAYQDPHRDIVDYYAGHMAVDRIQPFRFVAANGQMVTIYLAHGVVGRSTPSSVHRVQKGRGMHRGL